MTEPTLAGDEAAAGSPPARSPRRPRALGIDLVACAGLAAVALVGYATLPTGSLLRLLIALPLLFFVPGYLLAEAAAGPAGTAASRARRAVVALGTSPPIVGLLALATALLPGGFRPASIVTILAVACLALLTAASWRRMVHARRPVPAPTAA